MAVQAAKTVIRTAPLEHFREMPSNQLLVDEFRLLDRSLGGPKMQVHRFAALESILADSPERLDVMRALSWENHAPSRGGLREELLRVEMGSAKNLSKERVSPRSKEFPRVKSSGEKKALGRERLPGEANSEEKAFRRGNSQGTILGPQRARLGPNFRPLHAAQGGHQVQSRWLALAHGELVLAQPRLKLLTH
ncbi:hypothetical protein GQ44DRAFT_780268 [Phaeosphaeriaceae sp. PMI808]|nr:hypothetical protein GQ44DRAFT_780268 [Phaeosphaeriaceae sp. PMI808]